MALSRDKRVVRKATNVFAVMIAFLVATYLLEMPGELQAYRFRIAEEAIVLILIALGSIGYLLKRRFSKTEDSE